MPTNACTSPILSIVTPTRGNFTPGWLTHLLQVQGNVELILIYPPGETMQAIAARQPELLNDARLKILISPYRGEMMQRFVGLLNATGSYLLALDDDDFVHPQVLSLIETYFDRFPESWILRLQKAVIDRSEFDRIQAAWQPLPDLAQLLVCRKTPDNPYPYQNGKFTGLLEVPIAPLKCHFNWFSLLPLVPRKDNHGYHFENFNNIIWRADRVQPALPDLSNTTQLLGILTWIPQSGFDRLLGLYVQAKNYPTDSAQAELAIGHWIPGSEQIRYIDKAARLKPPRFHVLSDFLLVRRFPRFGYCWNLFFEKLYGVPRTIAKLIKWQIKLKLKS